MNWFIERLHTSWSTIDIYIYIYIYTYIYIYVKSSVQAASCKTSEVSSQSGPFLKKICYTKAKETCLLFYLPIVWERIVECIFLKSINVIGSINNLDQDLNLDNRVDVLLRSPLHCHSIDRLIRTDWNR